MSDYAALRSKLEQISSTLRSRNHSADKGRNGAIADTSMSIDHTVLMQEIQAQGNQAEDWLQYTRTLRKQLPVGNHDNNHNYLCHAYNLAFTSIPACKQKSMAYAQLLIDCAQIKSEDSPSEAHALLSHARTYARKFAVVHIAAAQFELRQGVEGKCRKILKKAQLFNVEPISLLEKAIKNFEEGQLQLLTDEEFGYSSSADSEKHSSMSSSDSTDEFNLAEKPPPFPSFMQSHASGNSVSTTEPSGSIPPMYKRGKDITDPHLATFQSSRTESNENGVCPLEQNTSACNIEENITEPRLPNSQSVMKENLMLSQSRNGAAAYTATRIRSSCFRTNQDEADTAPVMRTTGQASEADTAPVLRTTGWTSDVCPPSEPASCSKPFFRSYNSTPNMKHCPAGKSVSCTQSSKKWQSDINQPRRVIRLCLPELKDEEMEEEEEEKEDEEEKKELALRKDNDINQPRRVIKLCLPELEDKDMMEEDEEEALALGEDDDVNLGRQEPHSEKGAMDIDFSSMPTAHLSAYTSGYQTAMTGNSSLNTSHLLAANADFTGHSLQQKHHMLSGHAVERNKSKTSFITSTPAPGLARTGFEMADSGVISFHATNGDFKNLITPVPAYPIPSHEGSVSIPQLTSALRPNHRPPLLPYCDTMSALSKTNHRKEVPGNEAEVRYRELIHEPKQEPRSQRLLDNRKRAEEHEGFHRDVKRPAFSIHESGLQPQPLRTPSQQLFASVSGSNPVTNHQITPSLQQQQPSQLLGHASVPGIVFGSIPGVIPSIVPCVMPSIVPGGVPGIVPSIVPMQQQPNVSNTKILTVNKKSYSIQKVIGKGGSSKVYDVIDLQNNDNLAIKCVDLAEVDRLVIEGYHNEIKLLERLQYSDKVIKMFDYEHDKEHNKLYIILERGSTDLASLFRNASKTNDISSITIKFYWEAMLKAVQVLHKEDIVHSDLKPANFLLVQGKLKLIDFGIASTIQQDKTSITMETMIGTLNYMSPEAINDSCGSTSYDPSGKSKPKFKINVKSDVWSLGCILYNMVYSKTPFQHIPNQLIKLQAIINPSYEIEFPSITDLTLLDVMKKCLARDTKLRPSIDELLHHPYLCDDKAASAAAATPPADNEVPPMMRDLFSQLSKTMASASPSSIKAFQGFAQRLGQGFGFAAALNTSSTENEGSESLISKPDSVHSASQLPSQPVVKNIRKPLQNLNLHALLNGQTGGKSNKKS